MKISTFIQMSLISIASLGIFSIAAHAENSIFSASKNDQKQWVGKAAPAFKLKDKNNTWHDLKTISR